MTVTQEYETYEQNTTYSQAETQPAESFEQAQGEFGIGPAATYSWRC